MSTAMDRSEALRQTDDTGEPTMRASSAEMWGAIASLLVLALVAGLGLGWWNWGRVPAEGSPEVTFARDMSAHHDQAVEMALIMLDRTADPSLRTLLADIVLTQQNQIGQMNGWLALWGRPLVNGTPMQGHGTTMGMATQEQVNALRTLPEADAEVSFLHLMIAHHRGGVVMAQEALKETDQAQVVRLAESIVASQQGEINLMEGMLRERGADVPAAPPMDDQQNHDGMTMP